MTSPEKKNRKSNSAMTSQSNDSTNHPEPDVATVKGKHPDAKQKPKVKDLRAGYPPEMPLHLIMRWESAQGARTLAAAERFWETAFNDDDRKTLGNSLIDAFAKYGAVGMWREVKGGTATQAIIDISVAIGILTPAEGVAILRHCRHTPAPEPSAATPTGLSWLSRTEYNQIMKDTLLVIDEEVMGIWWQGQHVRIEWQGLRQWEFLKKIARKAKIGAQLTHKDFESTDGFGPENVATIKSRLINGDNFPASLASLIRSITGVGYKLSLPPAQIRIFYKDDAGQQHEYRPTRK